MKQINQTKFTATKILMMLGILIVGFQVQAQKVGDNLGNHKAIKALDMNTNNIVNAADVTATGTVTASTVAATNVVTATNGVVIGAAVFSNSSVNLEFVGKSKTMLITRVDDLLTASTILTPADGMMVYNNKDGRFYFRNNGFWETFASAPGGKAVLSITAGAPLAASNDNGFSLLNGATNIVGAASGDITLSLQPATDIHPGIVTIGNQVFSGSKTFGGNLAFKSTPASTDNADKVLVVEALTGNVKVSNMTAGLIGKTTVQIPVDFSKNQTPNSYFSLVFSVAGVTIDDGVVVNFKKSDIGNFAGITIKSAVATNPDEVTVVLEDDRNPDPATYTPLSIDGSSLIITWIHKN